MGSTVIIAIKHDQARSYSKRMPSSVSQEISASDRTPKLFGKEQPYAKFDYNRYSYLREDGILVSHYHDNEYQSNLLINHQMMISLPSLMLRQDRSTITESSLRKEILGDVKKRAYPYNNHLKKNGLVLDIHDPLPQKCSDSAISIFSIQTDDYNSDNFHHHFKSLLLSIDTGHRQNQAMGSPYLNTKGDSIYNLGGSIQPICVVSPGMCALINMAQGLITPILLPNREIDLSLANQDSSDSVANTVFYQFIDGLGIGFKEKPKQTLEQDSPSP